MILWLPYGAEREVLRRRAEGRSQSVSPIAFGVDRRHRGKSFPQHLDQAGTWRRPETRGTAGCCG